MGHKKIATLTAERDAALKEVERLLSVIKYAVEQFDLPDAYPPPYSRSEKDAIIKLQEALNQEKQ